MKAFLINLDRSTDRLAHMQREFERIGVEFSRISGVDGALLDAKIVEDFDRNRLGVHPEKWLPGEIGCFLSHFEVWQQIASGEAAVAAVFEDDVHLAADLKPLLSTSNWIPKGADIVRLETYHKMHLVEGQGIRVAPRRKVFRVASSAKGSSGYVITKPAAERLLGVDPKFHCWLDVFLFHPGRSPVAASLRTYQVVPAVCVQDQHKSGAVANLGSLIGATVHAPHAAPRGASSRLKAMLPWKKRPVEFRP